MKNQQNGEPLTYPLKDINPEWWARVTAKARAQKTDIKELIPELLDAWLEERPLPERSVQFGPHLWYLLESHASPQGLTAGDIARRAAQVYLGRNDARFTDDA